MVTSQREVFSLSGPLHISVVDWGNFEHRRCVAAGLVQGVYIQERDRQQNRHATHALAPAWWGTFHFQLLHVLMDDVDGSIFGAIYEFNSLAFNDNQSAKHAPKFVIAFRGTITKPASRSRDLKLDLMCARNKLHETSRFQVAMQAVQSLVTENGAANVWLVGHSLGSAIALLAGKNMAKLGFLVDAYLFNPPFLSASAPLEIIKNEKLKHGVRFTSSMVKAGLSAATKGHHVKAEQQDPFTLLSAWIPYLFVNPADHICSGYIGYFEHRRKMVEIGADKIERLATQNTLTSAFKSGSEVPLHLLPSAFLTINLTNTPAFKQAHGIHQWWHPAFIGQSELHEFK